MKLSLNDLKALSEKGENAGTPSFTPFLAMC